MFVSIGLVAMSWSLGAAAEKLFDHVPTRMTQGSQSISLEVVIFKPAGDGPFPTLLFNHGSGGRGNDMARLKQTYSHEDLAHFFNERGWLVAFPQRRGRGRSGGTNDEGYSPDRAAYSCLEEHALPGLARASQDVDAALDYVMHRSDVDPTRVVVGGQSRGGILAIAFAGKQSERVIGVVNFVGGWVGDTCADAVSINTSAAKQGATFRGPTLWLYGENDSMYKSAHSRRNFDSFSTNGGQGEFVLFALTAGVDGHRLIDHPDVWTEAMDRFLKGLAATRSSRR